MTLEKWKIYNHHKGRQSLDADFICKIMGDPVHQILEELERKYPDKKILRWPEKNPVMGMVKL